MRKLFISCFIFLGTLCLVPQVVASGTNKAEFGAAKTSNRRFQCELGNRVTVYRNATDNDHIKLNWRGRMHNMVRVATSTGANRFECKRSGLVWIDIPTKGILLDAKKGRQLANECRDIIKRLRST